ncbi:hypothetical protein EJB05_35676, partial [Eragrostis curvula]
MAIQWDKTTIIVTSVVGSLGVLSAILGFSAEGTKLTPYTIIVYLGACYYPDNPAQALAICAIVFLLVAQICISAVSGCFGCCKAPGRIPSETKRIVGIVCAVVSWIVAVIAWWLLVDGAVWNAPNVVRYAEFCYYFKDGGFAGAAVLCLAATALGLTSFIMLRQGATTSQPQEVVLTNVPGVNTPDAGASQPAAGGAPTGNIAGTEAPAQFVVGQPTFPQAVVAPSVLPQQAPLPAVNAMAQQQPQLVYVMQTPTPQPQYAVIPQQVLQQVPVVVSPSAPLQQGVNLPEQQEAGITKDDMIKAGVKIGGKLLAEAVKQSLGAGSTDPTAGIYS